MWDEQRIKQITGEDVIAARLPYGVPFTYEAQCTLIVVGNYNPDLEAITDAMSRRIKVIPWDNKPADPDKWLVDKLLPELPGILAWCVQGAMAWYEHGLPECEIVARETAAYVADQDTLGQWLESVIRVTGNPGDFIPGRDFYQNYVTWCRVNGLDIMSQRKFTQRLVTPLRAKGVARKRTGSSRGWEGAMLLSVEDAPSNVMNFPAIAEPPRNR